MNSVAVSDVRMRGRLCACVDEEVAFCLKKTEERK